MPLALRKFRDVPYLTLKNVTNKKRWDNFRIDHQSGSIDSIHVQPSGYSDILRLLPTVKRGSVAVAATHSAASAFGDDLADDDGYSVSEFSNYEDDKKGKKGGAGAGKKGVKEKEEKPVQFDIQSRLAPLNRQESIQPEPQEDPQNGDTSTPERSIRKDSTGSGENKSDEASSPSGDSDEGDVTITTFASFAKTRFQMKVPHTYSCSALPQPLLPKPDKADYLAALSSWVTMLRVMGDMPDYDVGDNLLVSGTTTPIVNRIKTGFQTKYTKKDVEEYLKKYSDVFKDPTGVDTKSMPFMTGPTDTMLDKIQMICAIGIYKPTLRDELYCQLCKQLTGNPSRNSSARGWVLMSLMVSSFAPSEKFISCLTSFFHDGPVEFADKVDLRLRRTCSAGTRGYPPSWLEFQAAKNGKPLLIPITCMNGHRMLYEMDGASTVGETVNGLCQRLGVKDSTGFSIYVSLQSRISCLGNGQHRVMDAVSECEQFSKMMGMKESNSMWRIFLRREFFAPWQVTDLDPISADLVYQQIKKGVGMGEYKFEKEDQLLTLASMIYTVEFSGDEEFTKLAPFLSDFIPDNIAERKAEDYFVEKIKNMVQNNRSEKSSKESIMTLKHQVIKYAKDEFYTLFSRYYDVNRVTGPGLQLPNVVLGINHRGIFLVDSTDKIRMRMNFCEIVEVSASRHHAVIVLVGQESVEIAMQHVDDFYDLVRSFLEGLRELSTLVIATKHFTQLDESPESSINKGDILELKEPLGKDQKSGNVRALNLRTSMSIDVPVDVLQVLTSMEKPNQETTTKLATHLLKDITVMTPGKGGDTPSLQQYAKSKFRSDSESSVSKFLSKASLKRKPKNDYLWQYSKDALKKPLLKKACGRDDVKKLACHIFASIQRYMASVIVNDDADLYNLCLEWILEPARRNKYTRDEVYCQVIKQLTNNPDKSSEDKGWILLTLLTSLILPGYELLDHVTHFVTSSSHPLADRCVNNIKLQERQGAYRLYSSHPLEHNMVAMQQPNVRIPIFFPNQTTQTVEITSQRTVFDIKKEVAARLGLKSFAEYSLFLTNNEKGEIYCLLDRAFFFDCLSHAECYWFKSQRRQSGKTKTTPMLVMLKKIWINSRPRSDPVADTTFHFQQEVPNYLRGYHPVMSPKQVIRIAAYMYRSLFGDDSDKFSQFEEVSPQIFPVNFMTDKNAKEIEEKVVSSYEDNKGMSQKDAKIKFLEELSSLSTYGSVFFEVKQRHVKSLPPLCLIAINFTGVHIIDRETKSILKTYEFFSIPNWAYDDVSFTFIFNENTSTSKLLVETKVGHNIDDLLMSYIGWIMNFEMRKKHGYVGEFSGESIC